MRSTFRLLDTTVVVDTESEVVTRLVRLLWSPFATAPSGDDALVLSVSGDDAEGWSIAGGDVPTAHADVWNLVDVLRHHMVRDVGSRLDGFVVLHAAALARAPHVVLLPGASGAGKTTIARALLDSGWSYLSDDLVPLERSTGLVHPFPKPLGIKDPSAWREMPAPLGPSSGWPEPPGTFLAPATSWPVAEAPAPPTHVVFPLRDARTEPSLEAVGAAEAATRLAGFARDPEPAAVSALVALAGRCACFDLRYRSPDGAVAAIERAVGGDLGGTT